MSHQKLLDNDWVGLSEASGLLGVSPATLRRWSDAGRLRVFTTPGGHRRFSRSALQRLLPADRSRRPLLGMSGLTPIRIARSYRRATREAYAELAWLVALTDEQRTRFRERGQLLASGLLRYLDAGLPGAAKDTLRELSVFAAEDGRVAAEIGLSLSQTVESFLRFRSPFLHELVVEARRRGFDTHETTDLMEQAERGIDQLLVATMTGHSVRSVQARGRDGGALASLGHATAERAE
jgi:excisionase family DNA binding protein